MCTNVRYPKNADTPRRRARRTAPACVFSGFVFRLRPRVEWMEVRALLLTFLVGNTDDGGPGSLRQAILDSNAAVGATNTIDFDIVGSGVQTILPLSSLPAIVNPVLIDGFSQPGYAGTPLIEIDGSQAGGGDGLLTTGADVTVRGLDVAGFSAGAGFHLTGTGATGDWVYANFVGTDPTGTHAEPNDEGVEIDAGASDNRVGTGGDGANLAAERNLISGNLLDGVWMAGPGTDGNVLAGNLIGTDLKGSSDLANGAQGVELDSGVEQTTIGGTAAVAGNVISGNDGDGIWIYGDGASKNVIRGNRIGTDVTGTVGLGNGFWGVEIQEGAANTVGGPNAGGGMSSPGTIRVGWRFTGSTRSETSSRATSSAPTSPGRNRWGTATAACTSAIGGSRVTPPRAPPSAGRPPEPGTSSRPIAKKGSGSTAGAPPAT